MNRRSLSLCARAAIVVSVGAAFASNGEAQQVNASARAFGMGGNFTALARGANTVAWNPANLGLSDNPGFSLQLGSVTGNSSLHPIDLNDIAKFQGSTIPASQREAWVQLATSKGGETGSGDVGVGLAGLSVGPFAFQLSGNAVASATLSPDAVEMIFFGNAGRTGQVKSLSLSGARMTAAGFGTGAVSFGHGFSQGTGKDAHEIAFGITGKYVAGSLAMARDNGSTIADSTKINFPAIFGDSGVAGSGMGVDLGFAWRAERTTFGVTIQNVLNSFAWDANKLVSRSNIGSFTIDSSNTRFDSTDKPFSAAPKSLRDAALAYKFKPTITAGLAREVSGRITVTADLRQQLADDASILIGPKTQAGVGAELRIIPLVPLRAGVAYVTGGFGVSGGLGLRVLGFELGVAGMLRTVDSGRSAGFMLSLVNIR